MKQFVFLLSLLLFVSAFDDNTLEDVRKDVAKGLEQLPDSLKDSLPQGLNTSSLPSVEEGEELLKERCDRYGTNESFDNAMAAKEDIQFCLRGLFNYTQMKEEIEAAKPTGDLDTVFRKYCRKTPKMRGCITDFVSGIETCLSPDEHVIKESIINVTDALMSFICFKEGDRIALFIAEEGPECLKDKQEVIQECLNSTFSKYIPKDAIKENEDALLFKLGEAECGDIMKLQACVVGHLETCSEPTPANIIDSLFRFVLKTTPCKKYMPSPSKAPSLSRNSFVLAITGLLLLARLY